MKHLFTTRLFTLLLALSLLLVGIPFGAQAALPDGQEPLDPFAIYEGIRFYMASSVDGSFIVGDTSSFTTLYAKRHNQATNGFWNFVSVGTVNGRQMYTIRPQSKFNYALTVDPATLAVTLQPYQANNNCQYWYQDNEYLDGEYLCSGAAVTPAWGKRLKVTKNSNGTASATVSNSGTLLAFIYNSYTAPDNWDSYTNKAFGHGDYTFITFRFMMTFILTPDYYIRAE